MGEYYSILNFHNVINLFVQSELLDEWGVRLNVLGKTELLPESVQRAIHRAEDMTRHNTR
jgi:ditrans,polycis-polyprenyl diphosphate synthase